MKRFKTAGYFLLVCMASTLTALWWNTSADPFCLRFFPNKADHYLYIILRPLLSDDIGTAAEQMDFLEVLLSAYILWSLVALAVVVYRARSRKIQP